MLDKLKNMTNATKAQIIVALNALMALLVAFGVNLSDTQQGAVQVAVNALLGVWIGLTFKDSEKRVPDPPETEVAAR